MTADVARGRWKFFAIAAMGLSMELLLFDMSVIAVIRVVITCGLLLATWIGHPWARVWLVVSACGGIVLSVYVGANVLDASYADPMLAFLGVNVVTLGGLAGTLLFSRDVRAYLEVEKMPQTAQSRESEREP